MYTYGIAEIYLSRDVVTTINMIDVSTFNQRAGSKTIGEIIPRQVVDAGYQLVVGIQRLDIGLTTTAIDIVDSNIRVFSNFQQQTIGAGH